MQPIDFDSLPTVPYATLLSTGHGMPMPANGGAPHFVRQMAEIIDGLYLGAAAGVDDIVAECSVRLILRMNAGEDEPPFRVFPRAAFKNDALVTGGSGALGGGFVRRGAAALVKTTSTTTAASSAGSVKKTTPPQNREDGSSLSNVASVVPAPAPGAVSAHTFYTMFENALAADSSSNVDECPLRNSGKDSWKNTPVFVRSFPGCMDDAGYNLAVHFAHTQLLIEKVLQARQTALSHGPPMERHQEEEAVVGDDNGDQQNKKEQQSAASAAAAAAATQQPAKKSFRASYGPPAGDKARFWAPSVVVHCAMGVSRSASIVAAYVLRRTRADARDVLSVMKKKRQVVEPNSGFISQLTRWRETEFLPLHNAEAFAREVFAKVESFQSARDDKSAVMSSSASAATPPITAQMLLERACYSLITARRPDEFDFFALHRAVTSAPAAANIALPSAFQMCVDALRRAIEEGNDEGFIYTTFSLLIERRFHEHPGEFLMLATRGNKKQQQQHVFSDSLARDIIWNVLPLVDDDDNDKNGDGGNTSQNLLCRVEDAKKRCSRALRLARLNTAIDSRLKAAVVSSGANNNNNDSGVDAAQMIMRRHCLEPVVSSFRRSFGFMPLLAFWNTSFWADVVDFLRDNVVGDDEQQQQRRGHHLVDGLLRSPLSSGSSRMEHATPALLLGILSQPAPPEPPKKNLSSRSPPISPRRHHDDDDENSSDAPRVVLIKSEELHHFQQHMQQQQQHAASLLLLPDPEISLFVRLAQRKAMIGGCCGGGEKDGEEKKGRSSLAVCMSEWTKEVAALYSSALSIDNSNEISSASAAAAAARSHFLELLCEKAVSAIFAVSLTLSPQLRNPNHQVKLRDRDDPAAVLPLPAIKCAATKEALSSVFSSAPLARVVAEAIVDGISVMDETREEDEKEGEKETRTVLLHELSATCDDCVKKWLAFFDLTFDGERGLLHMCE